MAVLPGSDDGADLKRWSLCAATVCAVHAGLLGSYLLLPSSRRPARCKRRR